MLNLHVVILQALAWSAPQSVSAEEVLSMMARIPVVEVGSTRPGGWEKRKDAPEIAAVIARVATSRKQAARLTIFGALEGGNDAHAVGDGGEAHGVWQLHGWCGTAPLERQARCWVLLEEKSETLCARLPEEERLAAVASGNCDHGRKLARRREALVLRILGEVFPEPEETVAVE